MKVKYNIDSLMNVIRDSSKDKMFFLDKNTGEIIELSLENPDLQSIKKIKEKIAAEPGRYPKIPKRSPHESYKDMEEFINAQKDSKLKGRLHEAIEGQGAFRCFRDVLEAHPKEKKNWSLFRDRKAIQFITQFLREIGVPPGELPQ